MGYNDAVFRITKQKQQMKSLEEIQKLAEQHYTQITLSQKTAFIKAYTQCQQDNTDIKYTEEDIKNAYNQGYREAEHNCSNGITEKGDISEFENAKYYIESLNKKD